MSVVEVRPNVSDKAMEIGIVAVLAVIVIVVVLVFKGIQSAFSGISTLGSGISKDLSNLGNTFSTIGNDIGTAIGATFGAVMNTKFSLPSIPVAPQQITQSSAQAAFNKQVAPYLISQNGLTTAMANYQPYANTSISPYAVYSNPITAARNVQSEWATPSAGDIFSGQDSGYGSVFTGQKVLLFNKSQEG